MRAAASSERSDVAAAGSVGLWAAAVAVVPGGAAKLLVAGPAVLIATAWWAASKAHRWLTLFFISLLLTPPFPGPIGDAGLHVGPVFVVLGILIGTGRMCGWDRRIPPVAVAMCAFMAVLLLSVGFAALYSGPTIAMGSFFRVGLFGIGVYVFLYAASGPRDPGWHPLPFTRTLFLIATASALFACVDFYYQFPAPAGFEQQFVWLPDEVLRRAQGLFYEASTLGNFCAFFLVMIAVAFFRPREESPCSRTVLVLAGAVFTTALILSYSRASVLNVVTAIIALAVVRGVRFWKPVLLAALVLAAAALAIRFALPAFSASYWARISASFQYFGYSPDGVLSGRLQHWSALADFLTRNPWHVFFGVGYKTLPYSNFTGEAVIADNTYLSLLVETGVIGLISFLVLNLTILRSSLRAVRSRHSFFGEWIFCFWTGQMVQMLSGDLITYWRVLPVYFWVLGIAVRENESRR